MSDAPPSPGDSLGPPETTPESASEESDGGDGQTAPSDSSTLTDILTASDPNPPLSEVGDLRSLRANWQAYGLRAVLKMTGADDSWAVVDAVKAMLGGLMDVKETGSSDGESSDPATLDDDLADLAGVGRE
jgi:hypothetical protein